METANVSKTARISGMIHILLLVGILILSAFLRLYKISEYMTFLGDEGRDVLTVKHLLEGDLVGLGPTASVGGFFTGPIYYYFMTPFLWLFQYDPVGPAIMVALFGIATVFLIYWVGKEFFNDKAGLFAAALYAVSPLVIAHSRSSWNPNPLPFFSLLLILFIYKAVAKNSFLYFMLAGISLGITVQLHYIAAFLGVIVASFVLLTGFPKLVLTVKRSLVTLFGFLVGYSPFLAFEATHGFPNTITVIRFIFGSTGETGFTGGKFTTIVGDVFFRLFARLLTRFPPPEQINVGKDALSISLYGPFFDIPLSLLYSGTMILALSSIGILLYKTIEGFRKKDSSLVLLLWLSIGILLFGFYRKPIYDYYYGFMFPLPFLLVGNLLSKLYVQSKTLGKFLSMLLFAGLFLINLDGMPQRYPSNRQLEQVKLISMFVLEKAEGRPFNFALITGGNSDHAYRYFLELEGNFPVTIENEMHDPERKTIKDQLLIICEDPACKPLGHPLWEVAGFGRAEIVGEWQVSVVKVYKLVHYKGE